VEDEKKKALIEIRNQAESIIYLAEKSVKMRAMRLRQTSRPALKKNSGAQGGERC